MKNEVKTIISNTPKLEKPVRVAAYARVSCAKDAMLHSLSAQVSRYSGMIQSHPGWIYCGVYSDEGISGMRADRPGLQKLLADCRAGKIDSIITKSVSRFARNTVLFIEMLRELRALGIDVFFEEQNIHSLSSDGELMITLLAGFAQEEALSVSQNQKWRVKKNFADGRPWNCTMLGYRNNGGTLEVVPEEAAVVKRIFSLYLEGRGLGAIGKILNEEGVPTRFGNAFTPCGLKRILRNYAYTGGLMLQTTFRENGTMKKRCVNTGELPMYHAEHTHEPIIDEAVFDAVQKELARRSEGAPDGGHRYPLSGLIRCESCGARLRRKTSRAGSYWICDTYDRLGKKVCPAKRVPEEAIETAAAEFDADSIEKIIAGSGNRLTFHFTDGTTAERVWKDRSRSESWTEEMRKAASEKTKARQRKWQQGT